MLTGEESLRDGKIIDYLLCRQRWPIGWLTRTGQISSMRVGQENTLRASIQRLVGAFEKCLLDELRIANRQFSAYGNRIEAPYTLLQLHGQGEMGGQEPEFILDFFPVAETVNRKSKRLLVA